MPNFRYFFNYNFLNIINYINYFLIEIKSKSKDVTILSWSRDKSQI